MGTTLLGCWTGGGYVHSVYAPEPPLLFVFCPVVPGIAGSKEQYPAIDNAEDGDSLFPECSGVVPGPADNRQ